MHLLVDSIYLRSCDSFDKNFVCLVNISKFADIAGAELRLQLVFFSLANLQLFLQTPVILIGK